MLQNQVFITTYLCTVMLLTTSFSLCAYLRLRLVFCSLMRSVKPLGFKQFLVLF